MPLTDSCSSATGHENCTQHGIQPCLIAPAAILYHLPCINPGDQTAYSGSKPAACKLLCSACANHPPTTVYYSIVTISCPSGESRLLIILQGLENSPIELLRAGIGVKAAPQHGSGDHSDQLRVDTLRKQYQEALVGMRSQQDKALLNVERRHRAALQELVCSGPIIMCSFTIKIATACH